MSEWGYAKRMAVALVVALTVIVGLCGGGVAWFASVGEEVLEPAATTTSRADVANVEVTVPATWRSPLGGAAEAKRVVLNGGDPIGSMAFTVQSIPRGASFDPTYPIEAAFMSSLAALDVAQQAGSIRMDDPMQPVTIGGLKGIQAPVRVLLDGVEPVMVFLVTVLEGPRHLHIIHAWTAELLWETVRGELFAVTHSFKDHNAPMSPSPPFEPTVLGGGRAVEPWSLKPPSEWPQVLLTNDVELTAEGQAMQGASAYLFHSGSGSVWAGTARHLIGPAGGFEPGLDPATLDAQLRAWRLHPRTRPEQVVRADRVAAQMPPDWDLLVLALAEGEEPEVTPLRVREQPLRVGEQLYMLGCPYTEPACVQNVYPCLVYETDGPMLSCLMEEAVLLSGFSGAPMVDTRGLLVGMMTGGAQGNPLIYGQQVTLLARHLSASKPR